MRRSLLLLLALAGCVDVDRYAPLDTTIFDPIALALSTPNDPKDQSTEAFDAYVFVDFDGDGHKDLIYGTFDGALVVHRGVGGGAFRPPVRSTLEGVHSYASNALVPMDLDGDGVPEIVAADLDAWRWNRVLEQPQHLDAFEPAGLSAVEAVVADTNGDGQQELWMNSNDGVTMWVWDGAHFQKKGVRLGAGRGAYSDLSVYDLDGDGLDDVFITPDDQTIATIRVFWGGPDSINNSSTLQCGVMVVKSAGADLDGDGVPDLIGIDQAMDINRCRGRGARTFADADLIGEYVGAVLLGVADFDRDRRPDPFMLDGAYAEARVLHNDHGLRFDQLTVPVAEVLTGAVDLPISRTARPFAADLDEDGRTDLLFWTASGLYWLRNVSH